MESNEISLHQVRIFRVLQEDKARWHTAKSMAIAADVNGRTARAHLLKFVRAGIVDQAEVFPGHRYKLSDLAEKRNKTLVQRIRQASDIFG